MTRIVFPERLQTGDVVLIGRGAVPDHIDRRRTVESVSKEMYGPDFIVRFTDGTARYYSPNRSVEVE